MGSSLQISLLVASIVVLLFVLFFVVRNKMNIHFAMIWIIWAVAMIVISAFPRLFYEIRNLLGIEVVSNAVFLVTIFFLYCLTFYLYVIISKQNKSILDLNYEIACLKKKIEEKNK